MVLIQLPNGLPFATAVLGTWASGLTATLVPPALASNEIAWILQNVRPRAIITATTCVAAMEEALLAQEDRTYFDNVPLYTVGAANEPYPHPQADPSESDWKRLLASASHPRPRPATFAPESRTAVILWSSGTSGRSKGVLLSHRAVMFGATSLWHDCDFYLGKRQRWLGFTPFYHVMGLLNTFVVAIATGSTVYTMLSFKLDAFLAAIPRRQITYLHMAPPVAVMLAKSPLVEPYASRDGNGRNAFSSVVAGLTGGAPLGSDIVEQVYSRLGFRIRQGYGLTEAGGVTLQPGLSKQDMEAQREDSGQPHWAVELMIAADTQHSTDTETQAAALGESGEILIRSPGLLMAYLPVASIAPGSELDMTATVEALTSDGWFRTGDVGIIRPDGSLQITDRIKELIKVRAFQVAPAELEALLCSSADILDAGVVGVYDEAEATEWPRAYVVAKDGTAKSDRELRDLALRLGGLVERQTARYKWLRGGVVFVHQIPKSPSGKILRRLLREGSVKGVEVAVYEPRGKSSKL